jgi:DNA (cytosine-5)-methyltransferase 1
MNELALFAGAGGGILGGNLLGWKTVCAVEIEPYAASVLLARQNDGILPPFPIWDDVQTFDGKPWRGIVDVVSGGFPCQDISSAGKGAGITGERSGLWKEFARIIGEVRPQYAFVENSPMLTSRGLGTVLGDLAEMGYDAEWGIVGAHHAGAPHKRDRIWILAYTMRQGQPPKRNGTGEQSGPGECRQTVADTAIAGLQERGRPGRAESAEEDGTGMESESERCREAVADPADERDVRRDGSMGSLEGQDRQHRGSQGNGSGKWWAAEPDLGRVAHGVAARVDRLKAIGNGQVPAVAALAWRMLSKSPDPSEAPVILDKKD